jgi:enterochelin esterase-like enzyme
MVTTCSTGSRSIAGLEPIVAADVAAREAWYGSWRLENQLDGAIAEGRLPPMIVVGIASDDGMRSRDLVPVPWAGFGEGRGTRYGKFVAGTVVAAIDRRLRTAPDRRCRGIGGASLGGVSAFQIGVAHADRFGLVLASRYRRCGDRQLRGRHLAGRRPCRRVRLTHRFRR